MDWNFDPALSSAAYRQIAVKRAGYSRSRHRLFVEGMLDERYDFGVSNRHVDNLWDKRNWNEKLVAQGRRPRLFIDAHINARHNAEMRCFGGPRCIHYPEDFEMRYFSGALARNLGSMRSSGGLIWIDGYGPLVDEVVMRRCPVAKALLFGHKARMRELAQTIRAEMDLLGMMELSFAFRGKNVSSVDFRPDIPDSLLSELEAEGYRRWKNVYRGDLEFLRGPVY